MALIASLTASADDLQKKALADYDNKNYPAAIADYEQLAKQSGVSEEYYFNLGNVYYRSGKKGKAVVSYERALRLNPRYDKARANLDFVNTKIVDNPQADENILAAGVSNVQQALSPTAWAIVAMTVFLLFLAGMAAYTFGSSIMLRKVGFFGGLAMLVVCVIANVFAVKADNAATCRDYAVVMADSTQLSTVGRAPVGKDEMAFMLHEGVKIKKVDSLRADGDAKNLWYKVQTADNREAWIKSTSIEEI